MAQARSPPKRVKSTERKGTERENKLPEPWYGPKNWLITTHASTERSVTRDFIENKKTNIMCCLYTRSQVSVREICPCWKTLLSVLMAVFCFCFHFSQLLCLYVCLRRGSPSSGAVLAPSTINGSSKCNGNKILWGSGENSSIWMIIQCNYFYQSPSLTMFDL